MKKIQRHDKRSNSTPPKKGPAIPPSETLALNTPSAFAALGSGEDFRQDAHAEGGCEGTADGLEHSKEEEELDIRRQPGEDGPDHKGHGSAEKHWLLSNHISQPSHAQDNCCFCKRKGKNDPLNKREADLKFGHQGGENDGNDADFQGVHEDTGAERAEDEPPLPGGKSVSKISHESESDRRFTHRSPEALYPGQRGLACADAIVCH